MKTENRLCKRVAVTIVLLIPSVFATEGCSQEETMVASEKLDPFIEKAFATNSSPGMAIAVVQGDELIYAKGFGYAEIETQRPVSPETIFYVASTTKAFTAFSALLLEHDSMLDLDLPISNYLPELKLQSPLSPKEITIRDLLTHTHGIANDGPVVFRTAYTGQHTHDQLIDLLSLHGPSDAGRSFEYGNIGYNVASLAMDASLEVSWKEILQTEIFEPLGMTNTSAYLSRVDQERLAMPYMLSENGFARLHFVKSDANMHAAGGIVTSALDLAKWLEVQMNSGQINGEQVFPQEVMTMSHQKHVDHSDRPFMNFHRNGWGFGWDIGSHDNDALISRFGGFPGFHSHVSFMPEHKLGIVILVNDPMGGSLLADVVARFIYDRMLEKPQLEEKYANTLEEIQTQVSSFRSRLGEHEAERSARSQALPHPLSAYAGRYQNTALGEMTWQVVDGHLEARMGSLWCVVEVMNGNDDVFRVELIPGRGEVISFLMHDNHADGFEYRGREFTKLK